MQEVSSYLVTEEQVEQDELNQHECMLPLMKLLDHMEHNKINPQVPKVNCTPLITLCYACIQYTVDREIFVVKIFLSTTFSDEN